MAKKDFTPTASSIYRAQAGECYKGAMAFAIFGGLMNPFNFWLMVGFEVLAVIFMVIGLVNYVFAHQSRMLEAADQLANSPSTSAAP